MSVSTVFHASSSHSCRDISPRTTNVNLMVQLEEMSLKSLGHVICECIYQILCQYVQQLSGATVEVSCRVCMGRKEVGHTLTLETIFSYFQLTVSVVFKRVYYCCHDDERPLTLTK